MVAHGNSLRGIVKNLSNIPESGTDHYLITCIEITELNIPTAVPLIYEFDENMKPVKDWYLADPEEL